MEKRASAGLAAPEPEHNKIYRHLGEIYVINIVIQNSHPPLACMESLQANQLLCLHCLHSEVRAISH